MLVTSHPYTEMLQKQSADCTGKEPGNINLQRGRLFGMVLFKKRVSDQGVGPAGQRQSGAGAGERFLVRFGIIKLDQELT